MKLQRINLDKLTVSPLNVRKRGAKDTGDLLTSIRALGLLQPLLVRPGGDGFEVVAGQRRYHALLALQKEQKIDPVPCLVMEDGEDTKAVEASLAENIARLPMDEIDQYKAFAALASKGLDADAIASRFGVTERLVRQRMAIANIIDPVLNAYRRSEVDAGTLRILTMASKKQQKEWWKLVQSEDQHTPLGHALKAWLFGGAHIPVRHALFDPAENKCAIVTDLFGEDACFGDADAFWPLQNAALARLRGELIAEGWKDAVIMETGEHFQSWEHVRTPKDEGGKVFIAVSRQGEIVCHKGWLSAKEARRNSKPNGENDGATGSVSRPELTKPLANYLGLHRHAAVRTELLSRPTVAFPLLVAHMISGSSLWRVEADPQRADKEAIAESLAQSRAEAAFAAERRAVRALIGLDGDPDTASAIARTRGRFGDQPDLTVLFARLSGLSGKDLARVAVFLMAESLEAHHPVVDALGKVLETDMRLWWEPDEAFFDLLRDKQVINAMVRDVAGDATADAHVTATAKVQKKIIADCLTGARSATMMNWLPRYMAFPACDYLNADRAAPQDSERECADAAA